MFLCYLLLIKIYNKSINIKENKSMKKNKTRTAKNVKHSTKWGKNKVLGKIWKIGQKCERSFYKKMIQKVEI